jgi:hypothetical protein
VEAPPAVVVVELATQPPLEVVGGAGELLLLAPAEATVAQRAATKLLVVADVGAQALGLAAREIPALHTAADVGLDAGDDVSAGDDDGDVAAVVMFVMIEAGTAVDAVVVVVAVSAVGGGGDREGKGDESEGDGLLPGAYSAGGAMGGVASSAAARLAARSCFTTQATTPKMKASGMSDSATVEPRKALVLASRGSTHDGHASTSPDHRANTATTTNSRRDIAGSRLRGRP